MSEQTASALRAWFRRVEPLYPELFNTAHVICGSYDQAEDALRGAILEVWADSAEGGMGFREKLRGAVREEALRLSGEDAGEYTWPGFTDTGDDDMLGLICREDPETQRFLMLRHGVGMSPGRISVVTGLPVSLVRNTLSRFESRCRRRLPARERGRFDALMARAAKRQLASRDGIPHPAAVYRAFESEASNLRAPTHTVSKIVYHLLVLVMALVCAALFWLFAVLVQPPTLQEQAPEPTAEAAFQIETTYESESPA